MWVLGKVEPGWYLAAAVWVDSTAIAWKKQGYDVRRENPDAPVRF